MRKSRSFSDITFYFCIFRFFYSFCAAFLTACIASTKCPYTSVLAAGFRDNVWNNCIRGLVSIPFTICSGGITGTDGIQAWSWFQDPSDGAGVHVSVSNFSPFSICHSGFLTLPVAVSETFPRTLHAAPFHAASFIALAPLDSHSHGVMTLSGILRRLDWYMIAYFFFFANIFYIRAKRRVLLFSKNFLYSAYTYSPHANTPIRDQKYPPQFISLPLHDSRSHPHGVFY